MANSIIALDVGERRIGVALVSQVAKLASPLTTLTNDADIRQKLLEIIAKNDVTMVVVGLPRNLSGEDTPQTAYVRTFMENLDLPVSFTYQDEALSSVRAEKELKQRSKSYEKSDIDALAATYILEDFLNQA